VVIGRRFDSVRRFGSSFCELRDDFSSHELDRLHDRLVRYPIRIHETKQCVDPCLFVEATRLHALLWSTEHARIGVDEVLEWSSRSSIPWSSIAFHVGAYA